MTIFNYSLAYSGETLIYNNECELLWPVDEYNPLDLPAGVIRVRTSDKNPPKKEDLTTYETAVLVSGTTDVYDVYKSGTNFSYLLYRSGNVVEVLGANTAGITDMNYMFAQTSISTVPLFDTSSVTNMHGMFYYCNRLSSVPLFDTSKVTNMGSMFQYCYGLVSVPPFDTSKVTNMYQMFADCMSLSYIPLFNTSNVTDMTGMCINCYELIEVPLFNTSKVTSCNVMFEDCEKVQRGALALYTQMSTQFRPPVEHYGTFTRCGRLTTTGAAELAQIPDDWKQGWN